MRTLGVDLGERRIGVALSDEDGRLASPLTTVERRGPLQAVRAIAALVQLHEAGEVVIGLPLNMDGTRGPAAESALSFADELRKRVKATVVLRDERLTTVAAHERLLEAGVPRREHKDKVDMVAAGIILQEHLDDLSRKG
jgi:putative Holliday junction resolvase